jgi:hypothetical protein
MKKIFKAISKLEKKISGLSYQEYKKKYPKTKKQQNDLLFTEPSKLVRNPNTDGLKELITQDYADRLDKKPIKEKIQPTINPIFKNVDVEEEHDEIYRAASELGVNGEELKSKIKSAKPQRLSNEIWSQLQNTDSWEISSKEDVDKLSKKYNRDADSIRDAFKNGKALPTPMIAKKGNEYVLIGGNTRLMVSKEMGIKPFVVIAEV